MVEEQAHLGLVHGMELDKVSMCMVDDDIVYPPPLLSHIEVSTNQAAFFDTITRFHSAMGTKFMIPVIGGKELNLHQLYVQVTQRGGLEKVILKKRWREVITTFNFPPTTTSASFVLRKYYLSLLHHYEQVYFFRTRGPLVAPSSILQTKTPLSKVDRSSDCEPTMRNKRARPPKKCKVAPADLHAFQAQQYLDSDDAPRPPAAVESTQATMVPANFRAVKAKTIAGTSQAAQVPTVVEGKPMAANKFAASSHVARTPTTVKSKRGAVMPMTPRTINANKFVASSHAAQVSTTVERKPAADVNAVACPYSVASAMTSGESTPPLEPSAALNLEGIRIGKSTPPGPVQANTTYGEHVSNGSHNLKVSGTINGKFEYGYLVSVKHGTEILNGVLYHVPPEEADYSSLHQTILRQPPPVASPASVNSPSNATADPYIPKTRSVQRRRKYKNRSADHPKPNRSAYNFFFAEMHAKLKVQHPHKERQYSKMIGESWRKLTPEEREVYNDYGKRDKERYRREKKEYERTMIAQPRGVSRIREPVRESEAAKSEEVKMVAEK